MSEFQDTAAPPTGAEGTPHRLRYRDSIAARIVAYTCLMFLLMTCLLVFISNQMYKTSFYNYSNKLCLSSNALAGAVINGDLVERFAKTFTVDEDYVRFAAKMDELKEKMEAKYFYILVDNGVPGMYTYIYDATHSEEYPGEEYALGLDETIDEYEGAAEVLATGKGFEKAEYYNDKYGELYYAYAPIFNSQGKAVAFVGTDIDITPLHAQMGDYRLVITSALVVIILGFSLICFLIVRHTLTLPMQRITDGAIRLSRGDMDLRLPPATFQRRDEISRLGAAFEIMARSISGLILDIEHIMRAARDGLLGKRADPSVYRGDYRHIISGVNKTLDVVCRHFDAIADAIGLFDASGNLLYGNRTLDGFTRLHGLDPRQKDFFVKLLGSGAEGSEEKVRRLFGGAERGFFSEEVCLPGGNGEDGGESRNYALTLLRAEEDAFLSGDEFFGPAEEPACVMMMLSDVTMLIRARNDAEAASRAKSAFLSRMSHEIRTPMNAISGMAQIAKSSTDLEKIRSCLAQIDNSCGHLLGIVNDILDFSKVEAGKLKLDEREFSLVADLDFVVSMMMPRAREKDLAISLRAGGIKRGLITADSLRLNQVLLNLLSNAIKFSHRGGEIVLSVEEMEFADGKSVYSFTVRDQGIGIDARAAERLFLPFEQAENGTSRTYGGTGLGLVIARSLVEMMDGKIFLESEPGKGSAFTFTIRVLSRVSGESEGSFAPEPAPEAAPHDFSGKRALIVDDIDINREILLGLLQSTGIAMDEAENGRKAVDVFNASPSGYYDIVLMDMQMPVMDGCDATREIRALNRPDAASVFIVAMTANVMKEDVDKALAAGMNAHLGKPIVVGEVLSAIDRALKSQRA